jgi:pimeloyl-ACP methyl ester carboxylesterase
MLAASQDRSFPEPLIRRLVLVAPANPFMPNARLRLAIFRSPFAKMVMRGVRRIGIRSSTIRRMAMCRMYSDRSRITPETRAGYEINFSDSRSYEYALEVVRTWRPDMRQLRSALQSIADIPVLLLWGADDKAVSAKSGLRLRKFFRDAQYAVLPNVGHLAYEESPEEFNRIVLQFLES